MSRSKSAVIRTTVAGALVVTLSCASAGLLHAYDQQTHEEISDAAVNRSRLDEVLKRQYGIADGVAFAIDGRSVLGWIRLGSNREDSPPNRVLNHFHNPLEPWSVAGLLNVGQSSVYWQQNPNQDAQGGGGTWSWPVTRQRFFEFLTKASRAERNSALADTARALGQTMHLIEDVTVPAHARNDAHLTLVDPDVYEDEIEKLRVQNPSRFNEILARSPITPSTTLFTSTNDLQAPVPVARLIDSDSFERTLATYSTGGGIGLAEYTNGGYVSNDTIFRTFALPRVQSLDQVGFFDPPAGTSGARRYFAKVAEGDAVSHFVAEGTFFERLRFRGQAFGGYILNGRTAEAAAENLLPRAVGYSAALLDYFFRGRLDVQPVGQGLQIINRTPNEAMVGSFSLYYDAQDGSRVGLGTWQLTLGPDEAGLIPQLPPYPEDKPPATAGEYLLVFRGRLGDEPDAVVAHRLITLSPYDIWLDWYPPHQNSNTKYPIAEILNYEVGGLWLGALIRPPSGRAFRQLIYRGNLPGSTLTMHFDNLSGCTDEFTEFNVVLQLVKHPDPSSEGELDSYRFDSPPAVESVIGEFAVFGEATFVVAIGNVKFFSFLILDQQAGHHCQFGAYITLD